MSKAFTEYLLNHDIKHEFIAPANPEQNSVAKRDNRTIMEMVRSCIHHSEVSQKIWAEAVHYAIYTLNRTGSRLLHGRTPYEVFTCTKPSVSHMRTFGCPVFIHTADSLRNKLQPKSRSGIFLGCSTTSKAYRVWDLTKRRVVISQDIICDESGITSSTSTEDLENLMFFFDGCRVSLPTPPLQVQQQPDQIQPAAELVHKPAAKPHVLPDNHGSSTPACPVRHRRPPDRFSPTQYAYTAQVFDLPSIPQSYSEAISSEHGEQWHLAMKEELQSLAENKTWELRELPHGRKAIRNKWVYAYKTNPDGSLARFKARLVAKGCSQKPGVDFSETFSRVVHYYSIRTILALCAFEDYEIVQFDIKTAFLNGLLSEEIYMQQQVGFEDRNQSHLVYRLLCSLYGLWQASRV